MTMGPILRLSGLSRICPKACSRFARGQIDRGVLICGTGIGISLRKQDRKGAAALCTNSMAKCPEHNDAQVLVLGGRNTSLHNALQICESFFKTAFAGGRHQRRVDKIDSSMLASINKLALVQSFYLFQFTLIVSVPVLPGMVTVTV